MFPTPKDAHVDSILSNMSVRHQNASFVASRVFPILPVLKKSDKYFKFLKGDWFRVDAQLRGPGGEAARSGYKLTSATYSCEEWALAHPIPIELLSNADAPLNPFQTGIAFVTNGVFLRIEVLASALAMTSGNWTSSEDCDAGWAFDAATNTFIHDVNTAKETIRKRIGVYPNRMVMDAGTFANLKENPDVLDRIKYTGTQGRPADVTPAVLAALFELDEVVIGQAIYSSDEETIAGTEFTAVQLWEVNATKGSALLYYHTGAPAIDSPNAGYIFNWKKTGMIPAEVVQRNGYREVRRWWESSPKQWVVECSADIDAAVVGADAGHLFYDTIVT